MRATWIGAILVHVGIAAVVKRRPITIRLKDKYLRLKKHAKRCVTEAQPRYPLAGAYSFRLRRFVFNRR